ncbi:MAG: response regulator [bacterium]|jgi:CheY-like chemotaxis protein|nr:response regulator [candidate division KSB1 bacterium]MDH7559359.1 response regulator [bacterium]
MDGKPKILVVEDEQIVALDMKGMLQRLGYVVTGLAATGEQAIDKAGLTRPDLVLMDIKLRGDMDGVQAAQEIKARYGIPVIYLTANTDQETYERAMATGPAGYLQKPFELQVLAAALAKALQATRAGATTGSSSPDACRQECVQENAVTEGGGRA